MRRPMIPLTISIAILDKHTRLTCLEANTSAAIRTAVHPQQLAHIMVRGLFINVHTYVQLNFFLARPLLWLSPI